MMEECRCLSSQSELGATISGVGLGNVEASSTPLRAFLFLSSSPARFSVYFCTALADVKAPQKRCGRLCAEPYDLEPRLGSLQRLHKETSYAPSGTSYDAVRSQPCSHIWLRVAASPRSASSAFLRDLILSPTS